MNAELLLAYFNRISEAPDAVPRLRRFVLDLAIRGKLVRQDPNDEPASELLEKIQAEKARLVKEGKINREDPPTPASPDDLAFELKPRWQPASIRQILVELQTGPFGSSLHQSDYQKGGIPVINPASIKNGRLVPLDNMAVGPATLERLRTFKLRAGDIVMARRGEMGRCAIVTEREHGWLCGTGSLILRLPKSVFARFFVILIGSPFAREYLGGSAVGATMQNLNQSILLNLVVGLPPAAEQKRIVTKVDELMALCDQLETAQAERESRRDRLVMASFHHLSHEAHVEKLREHANFYLSHISRLSTRNEHIRQLRQTIRNLAIRGLLVHQSSGDEPAAEFLKRIRAKRVGPAKGGRNGRETGELLTGRDVPFSIPENWVWVRFGKIIVSRDGERIPISKEERNLRAKRYNYYGASGVIDKIDNYLFDKPLLLIGEDGANLINRSTPIAFIARGKYWVNNHAHVLDGISEMFLRFIELQINAIDLKPYVTGTAQPKMNQAKMNSIPIALAPEAEQNRIVAKVDELMSLCDQIEAGLNVTKTKSGHLLEAILDQALNENRKQSDVLEKSCG
jgi:type I restriction enzyme S subunit